MMCFHILPVAALQLKYTFGDINLSCGQVATALYYPGFK